VKRFASITAALFCGLVPLLAQQNFKQGESLLMRNKPYEARPFFESAVREDPDNVMAYLYLAMTYQMLEQMDDAIATYLRILPRAGAETARVAFSLGNIYYGREDRVRAQEYYTKAIEADPAYSSAYLNRANSFLEDGAIEKALEDYSMYLTLEPRSPQRPQIERIRSLALEEFTAEAERQRLAQEEAAAVAEKEAEEKRLAEEREAEERRLAEEREAEEKYLAEALAQAEAEAEAERQRAEEEQRQAQTMWHALFLEDVLSSLLEATALKTNIKVGTATLMWEAEEFELD
jgi:tetratricopeptide (TPR) repeat protein